MSTLKIKNNQGSWDYIQLAGPDAFQDAVKYYTATGSANTYAITTSPTFSSLTEGYGVVIKIPVNSTAASTLNVNSIGAKAIKKADGSNVTNLKAGGVYTLRYDGTNFILQGEGASGDATASDLLSGKTATTDAGEIVGTMTNRGAVNQSLAINGTYTIPAGYHNGSGSVSQSITTKGAQTYTPSTANQTIAAGQYLSGVQTILGDPDLVAGNIKSGVNIFGVAGTLPANNAKIYALLGGLFNGTTFGVSSASTITAGDLIGLGWPRLDVGYFRGGNFVGTGFRIFYIEIDLTNVSTLYYAVKTLNATGSTTFGLTQNPNSAVHQISLNPSISGYVTQVNSYNTISLSGVWYFQIKKIGETAQREFAGLWTM